MPPTFTSEGIRAALVVREMHPRTAVVVLSQYVEEEYARRARREPAPRSGLLKDRWLTLGSSSTQCVPGGGRGDDARPGGGHQLLIRSRHKGSAGFAHPREREVLALMAQGRANAGIAAALVVTEGAVEKHVSSIFAKLDLAPTDGELIAASSLSQYLRNDS